MRILFVCTKYSQDRNNSYLTDELARNLAKVGNDVRVICIEWDHVNQPGLFSDEFGISGLNVHSVFAKKTRTLALPGKWFFSSLVATLKFLSWNKFSRYDLVISFSPCVASWATMLVTRILSSKMLLIYWDFFPVHQIALGMLPKGISPYLYLAEFTLVRLASYVGLMSPKNIDFFNSYFRYSGDTFELPVWRERGSSFSTRIETIDSDKVVFVFGGQLTHGRGLEDICNAAVRAHSEDKRIVLNIFGDGPLRNYLKQMVADFPDVINYVGPVSRSSYLEALALADVGIVATVSGVPCPTYPSKSLDYMLLSLPIIASIEEVSDFGRILSDSGAGISVVAGDISGLTKAFLTYVSTSDLRKKAGDCARKLFDSRHNIDLALDKINKLEKVHNR